MAPSDPMSDPSIKRWLFAWAQWLELWLECGTDAPTTAAIEATKQWLDSLPAGDFETVETLSHMLLDRDRARGERARALLDLLAWQRTADQVYWAQTALSKELLPQDLPSIDN